MVLTFIYPTASLSAGSYNLANFLSAFLIHNNSHYINNSAYWCFCGERNFISKVQRQKKISEFGD